MTRLRLAATTAALLLVMTGCAPAVNDAARRPANESRPNYERVATSLRMRSAPGSKAVEALLTFSNSGANAVTVYPESVAIRARSADGAVVFDSGPKLRGDWIAVWLAPGESTTTAQAVRLSKPGTYTVEAYVARDKVVAGPMSARAPE